MTKVYLLFDAVCRGLQMQRCKYRPAGTDNLPSTHSSDTTRRLSPRIEQKNIKSTQETMTNKGTAKRLRTNKMIKKMMKKTVLKPKIMTTKNILLLSDAVCRGIQVKR